MDILITLQTSPQRSPTWLETELDTDGELSCIMSGGAGGVCFQGNIFQGVRGIGSLNLTGDFKVKGLSRRAPTGTACESIITSGT